MRLAYLFLVATLVFVAYSGSGQDDVTIPKSRLKELERKEAELERMKGKSQAAEQTAPAPAPSNNKQVERAPKPTANASGLATRLQEGQPMSAVEVANLYSQGRESADQLLKNRKLTVRGKIVGFSKPLVGRNYRVMLGGEGETKVICDFVPSSEYRAVFPADDGQVLVALQGETRRELARIGEQVVVEGVAKGLRKSAVLIHASSMHEAK